MALLRKELKKTIVTEFFMWKNLRRNIPVVHNVEIDL